MACYRMVGYGILWYFMVWYCTVWYGIVWFGMVWCGMVYSCVLCCGPDDKAVGPPPGMDPSIWGSSGQIRMALPPFRMMSMIRQQSRGERIIRYSNSIRIVETE